MGGNGSHEKAPPQGSQQDPAPPSSQPAPLPATLSIPSISFQRADEKSKQVNTMSENSKIVIQSSSNIKFRETTNGSEQTNSMSGSSMVQITEPPLAVLLPVKKTDYNK